MRGCDRPPRTKKLAPAAFPLGLWSSELVSLRLQQIMLTAERRRLGAGCWPPEAERAEHPEQAHYHSTSTTNYETTQCLLNSDKTAQGPATQVQESATCNVAVSSFLTVDDDDDEIDKILEPS